MYIIPFESLELSWYLLRLYSSKPRGWPGCFDTRARLLWFGDIRGPSCLCLLLYPLALRLFLCLCPSWREFPRAQRITVYGRTWIFGRTKKERLQNPFFNILISWIILLIIIIWIIIIWIIPADPCGQNGQHTQKQGFGCVEQSQAFWNAFWQVFFAAAATTAARTTTAPPPAATATAVGKCFHTICIYFVEFMSLCQCHILSS